MSNPTPILNNINAFDATQGTTISFNIIGGTDIVRSNIVYIYDLSTNDLICTHLYISTESIHELPPNTDPSIVYASGKSSADFVNNKNYYLQIQTFTNTAGTVGGSGMSVAKTFWCLSNPSLSVNAIPAAISTTSYNVSATYNTNVTDTSIPVTNIIQQYKFDLYTATGTLVQTSGNIIGSGEQEGTSTTYNITYNFSGLVVNNSYYVVVTTTSTEGMTVSAQSNTFTVSIDTPTLGEATVVNNACDGYISVTSNLSGEYGGSASGEIATFETDSVNDVSSLKVTLTPQQDGTPWIGTDHDTTPYLNRAMPTQSNDYNRESGVIVGGTVAWNQLAIKLSSTDWATESGATATFDDGVATVSSTTAGNGIYQREYVPSVKGHKYLVGLSVKGASGQTVALSVASTGIVKNFFPTTDNWERFDSVLSNETTNTTRLYAFVRDTTYENVQFKNIQVIDLTQLFGTAIADYIYSLEQATAGAGVSWFRKYFPEDYYPYSQPTLQSVQATAHKTYDGGGNVIGNYALDSSVTLNGLFQLDNGELKTYGDIYPPSGDIQRKFIKVDLGTLTYFNNGATTNCQQIGAFIDGKANGTENFIVSGGWTVQQADVVGTVTGRSGNNAVVFSTTLGTILDDFKTAMSGTYMVFELAIPTTETADPYTNPQIVDPDGTEEYVTANYVPVGHDSTYSLVCPISGYDEVSANVVGVNLFNKDNYNVLNGYIDSGVIVSSGSSRSVVWMECKPNTTYAISRKAVETNERFGFGWTEDVPAVGTSVYGATSMAISTTVGTTITRTLTTGADAKYLAIWLGWTDRDAEAETFQLELGTTATTYEPYNGTTYTATLPQTVYGGTVDLVSGLLTVDKKLIDLGTLTYSIADSGHYGLSNALSDAKVPQTSTELANIVCSHYMTDTQKHVYDKVTDGTIALATNGTVRIYDTSITASSGTEFATKVSGTQLCYELATPQTIQLTPQEIQTLVGTNNVWSDSGDVEITYNIPITNLLVKRQDVADVSGTWLTLYSQPVTQASDMDFTFIDFLNQYGKTYKYALVPLLTQQQGDIDVEIEGGYTVSDDVLSVFDGVFIANSNGSQKLKAATEYGDLETNQDVGVLTTIGGKYPFVVSNSNLNYHSGSISALIVPSDFYTSGDLDRLSIVERREAIEQFLTDKTAKILKDWNGNIWLITFVENVEVSFVDDYGMGLGTLSAKWVEIGDVNDQTDLKQTGLI